MKGVVVLTSKRRIITRFPDPQVAAEFYRRVKALDDPRISTVHYVDCLKPTPPPTDFAPVIRRHRLWCPYCAAPRDFTSPSRSYHTCPVCGISDADYFVRTYNHLWPTIGAPKRREAKRGATEAATDTASAFQQARRKERRLERKKKKEKRGVESET